MLYEIIISDSTGTEILPQLNVPLAIDTLEGATDVVTLDMNMYTDFFAKKELWTHTWQYMTDESFEILKGYYDRQFQAPFEYPLITISALGIVDQVVRMNLTPQRIIDKCGTVENVTVTFRETIQTTNQEGS